MITLVACRSHLAVTVESHLTWVESMSNFIKMSFAYLRILGKQQALT